MEMLDVIRRLSSLERYANACRQDAESCGDPIAVAGIYQHDAEALRTAISVLRWLEGRKAEATTVATALHICGTPKVGCPPVCPYSNVGDKCISSLELDAERLLTLAYLQGGGSNGQC